LLLFVVLDVESLLIMLCETVLMNLFHNWKMVDFISPEPKLLMMHSCSAWS
jgi:hypothetical protein